MADITRVVQVSSLAVPSPEGLRALRLVVQNNATVAQAMLAFREQGAEAMAEALRPLLPEFDPDTVRYLCDEYVQVGDGLLLISQRTGRAVARLGEEDLWTPPAVARHDGTVVPRPKAIRPDILASLVVEEHDQAVDANNLEAAARSLYQTPLQRQEGDARLAEVTRAGRAQARLGLQEDAPTWWTNLTGSWGVMSTHVVWGPAPEGWQRAEWELRASIEIGVPDARAFNLHFTARRLRGAAMGRLLLMEVFRRIRATLPTEGTLATPADTWLMPVHQRDDCPYRPGHTYLWVDMPPLGLRGRCVALEAHGWRVSVTEALGHLVLEVTVSVRAGWDASALVTAPYVAAEPWSEIMP